MKKEYSSITESMTNMETYGFSKKILLFQILL